MTSTNQVRSYAVEHHLKLKGHCIFPFSEELNKQLAVLLPKFPTTDATGIIDEGRFREKIPFGGKHAGKLWFDLIKHMKFFLKKENMLTVHHCVDEGSLLILKCNPGCPPQRLHCDDTQFPGEFVDSLLEHIPYSVMLNPGSEPMWLNTLCGPIVVDSGSGIIFPGDFLHGGMSWDCKNEEPHLRLFLKVDTDLFCGGYRKRKSFYLLDNHEIKYPGNVVRYEDIKKCPVLHPLSDSHSVIDLTIDDP